VLLKSENGVYRQAKAKRPPRLDEKEKRKMDKSEVTSTQKAVRLLALQSRKQKEDVNQCPFPK
jgi:hypothetical protein